MIYLGVVLMLWKCFSDLAGVSGILFLCEQSGRVRGSFFWSGCVARSCNRDVAVLLRRMSFRNTHKSGQPWTEQSVRLFVGIVFFTFFRKAKEVRFAREDDHFRDCECLTTASLTVLEDVDEAGL